MQGQRRVLLKYFYASGERTHQNSGRMWHILLEARGHGPHIAWASELNGDLPIPSEEWFRVLPSGSLVIRRVHLIDEGMYHRVASNPAGSATAAALLKVTDE